MGRGQVKEEDRAESERQTEENKEDVEREVKEEDRAESERQTEESKGDVERGREGGRQSGERKRDGEE